MKRTRNHAKMGTKTVDTPNRLCNNAPMKNKHAQELGKMARGKKKRITPERKRQLQVNLEKAREALRLKREALRGDMDEDESPKSD